MKSLKEYNCKGCIYFKEKMVSYSYPLFPNGSFMVSGEQIQYLCFNPKMVKHELYLPKHLTRKEKFNMCKFKVTHVLGDFIK